MAEPMRKEKKKKPPPGPHDHESRGMTDPERLWALDLETDLEALDDDMKHYLEICRDKLGLVPNALKAYAVNTTKLRNFVNFYNDLMLSDDSGLSRLEREMIATAVSSANRCFSCITAHGAQVRKLSGDPILGEMLAQNYRVAALSARHGAMLDFTVKLTERPHEMVEADREALRAAGFTERDIYDIADVAAFFNMTNRKSSAVDSMPNPEYHAMAR